MLLIALVGMCGILHSSDFEDGSHLRDDGLLVDLAGEVPLYLREDGTIKTAKLGDIRLLMLQDCKALVSRFVQLMNQCHQEMSRAKELLYVDPVFEQVLLRHKDYSLAKKKYGDLIDMTDHNFNTVLDQYPYFLSRLHRFLIKNMGEKELQNCIEEDRRQKARQDALNGSFSSLSSVEESLP